MDKRPNSKVNLDRAIQRIYGTGAKYVEIRSMIANTIVGQFLPEGVVKGGSALRLRYGLENTRVTVDFDTAHRNRLEDFINTISSGLKEGWSDFSGEVVRREPAKPRNIPAQYVMQPFDVKLRYCRQPWCTVRLEAGYDEIGDAQVSEAFISEEIVEIFKTLCLDIPKPVPLMPLPHQVAQKLHGLSDIGGNRAHDLIDLQLIFAHGGVDLLPQGIKLGSGADGHKDIARIEQGVAPGDEDASCAPAATARSASRGSSPPPSSRRARPAPFSSA